MIALVTGASGLIGSALCDLLLARGDTVRATTRNTGRVAGRESRIEWVEWDPWSGPLAADALDGVDAVVNLAGEPVAQRWNSKVKRRIRESRITGTRNLVAAIAGAGHRPSILVSGSAVGYYGDRGDERLDESAAPGEDFLATVCVEWEAEAAKASELGIRLVTTRTGVVLAAAGGALAKMLPPFRMGVGGPVGAGRQYMPWVHVDDVVGMILWAIDTPAVRGPLNVSAPEPVTNAELSRALGRALRRPAVMHVPPAALRLMYGEMAGVITGGQRAIPARAEELGYEWRFTDLAAALVQSV